MKTAIRFCSAAALVVALAACDSDGDTDDASVEDTAEPERTGGPTTTVDAAADGAIDGADLADGAWLVGETVCEAPPDDDDDFAFQAEFATPELVAAGATITVSLDQDVVTTALELDEPDTEVASYGGDHLIVTCWDGGGWTPVWLVRLPGFVPVEADDEDGDLVDAEGEEAGSYQLGPDIAITGTDIVEPFSVDVEVPAEIPAGQYRWAKTIGLGFDDRYVIVQPVEITAG